MTVSVAATGGRRRSISAISALTNTDAFWYHVYSGRLYANKFIEFMQDFVHS